MEDMIDREFYAQADKIDGFGSCIGYHTIKDGKSHINYSHSEEDIIEIDPSTLTYELNGKFLPPMLVGKPKYKKDGSIDE